MTRYAAMFTALDARGDGAFVPFLMLGDPTPEASLDAAETLLANGADALELGIPFSEPVADGAVIQAAAARALRAGTTPTVALELVRQIRARHPGVPLGLLTYANPVVRRGCATFYAAAAAAGADSVLVADVPSAEAAPFIEAARTAGIAPVLVAAPNTPPGTLERIARLSEGYVYLLGRAGVTGADRAPDAEHADLVARLRRLGAPPVLIGFGVSEPGHVRAALAAGAAGAIAGSAVVRLMQCGEAASGAANPGLGAFTRRMKEATLRAG